MRKSDSLLAVLAASLLLAGCVTTTTTTNASANTDSDDDNAADLNYQLGARYLRNGSYVLARDRLLLSIELNPRNAIAHYTLALTYERLDNERLATESYEEAIRIQLRNYDDQRRRLHDAKAGS
jgi:Tfp pilus assembly protein PilF